MGIELQIVEIFDAPTLAEQAMAIDESTPAPESKAG
jgi:hypothetical protein